MKLDRLTRSVRDLGDLVERYFTSKCSLLSVSDSIDTRTAGGRLVLNVLASVSQWEREATAERTRESLAHLRSQGVLVGGVPLGRRRTADYHADLDLAKVDALIGNLVDFLERFLREQLEESLFKHVSPTAEKKIRELAAVVETARRVREREWKLRARKYRNLSEKKLRELCVPYEEAYVHPKHGPEIELATCPDCGCVAVVAAEKDVGVCTDCAAVHVLAQCESCKRDFVGDQGLCDRCEPYVGHAFVGDAYVGDGFFVFDGDSGKRSERADAGEE